MGLDVERAQRVSNQLGVWWKLCATQRGAGAEPQENFAISPFPEAWIVRIRVDGMMMSQVFIKNVLCRILKSVNRNFRI